MSTVTDRQPEVIAIDARIAKAREQERTLADKSAKAATKYRAAYAKWEAEAIAAELAGKDPKPAPPPPDETTRRLVMQRLRAQIDRDIVERRRAIVSAADTIREGVEREAAEIVAGARGPLEELREAALVLRRLIGALDEIADARQSLDPYQATPLRRPPVVDLSTLVGAIDHGLSAVLEGRDTHERRTLGVQSGSTLDVPPTEGREPASETTPTTVAVGIVRTAHGAEL
ncbi:hypothetical protein [Aeromicrobium chenweiae]|uniref:Uncharacterized protein n=1 Tax=Aeromicrobium chenweiae TaxID=2079793 RepID=A0A2S0WHP6_9ACTN|nr:hypothetical protein [Aeromicrobium chenweiae]AWB90865.1 hypothetical protein C3E78_00695 [Aeromicrobium chenweiae]TGN32084.1 hypothetical protein E4L97_10210 [Aeromicrobium chenweiae]